MLQRADSVRSAERPFVEIWPQMTWQWLMNCIAACVQLKGVLVRFGKTAVHERNSPRAPDSCEYEWAQWETKSHDYKRTDGLRTYAQSLT